MAGLPIQVAWTVYQGADFDVWYRWKPAGVPQDFTGWQARSQMRKSPADTPPLVDLDTQSKGGITLTSGGDIKVHIEAAVTDLLTAQRLRGDLELISPSGGVTRFLMASITVVPQVTR